MLCGLVVHVQSPAALWHRESHDDQSDRVRRVASQRCARGEGRHPHRSDGVYGGRGQGLLADLSRVRRGRCRSLATSVSRLIDDYREPLFATSPTRWPTRSGRKAIDLESRTPGLSRPVFRSRQEGVVTSNGVALPAGRASVAADHRPADFDGASDRQVTGVAVRYRRAHWITALPRADGRGRRSRRTGSS